MSWIREDIDISDIPMDKVLKNTILEAEELDREGSVEFFCVGDAIDVLAKQMKTAGIINDEQWGRLCSKYPGN